MLIDIPVFFGKLFAKENLHSATRTRSIVWVFKVCGGRQVKKKKRNCPAPNLVLGV